MTLRRIKVEDWSEPKFTDSVFDTKQNVLAAQDWLSVELEEASGRYRFGVTESIRGKLFEPPLSVQDFALHQQFSGDAEAEPDVIDDAGVALFALSIGRSAETIWEELTKEERRKARATGVWWFSANRVERRGKPIDTDIPLLLFLVFTIEEVIRRKFPRSRTFTESKKSAPSAKRPPSGPAFMLLRAAYAQASVRLHVMPSNAETVYRVVHVARLDAFRRRIREIKSHALPADTARVEATLAELVAAHPNECRRLYVEEKRTD